MWQLAHLNTNNINSSLWPR
ncbi:peptidase M48 family protein, partial [Vibrio parahaemolyticus V-223/04]